MLELDQMLDGLTIATQPFAICEARGDHVIDLGTRQSATLHYVLAGSGSFTLTGQAEFQATAGTILVTPAQIPHRVRAKAGTVCEVLNCAPLSPDWSLLCAGEGANGIIVACSEISVAFRGIDGIFNYLQTPLISHLIDSDPLKSALAQVLDELAIPQAGGRSLVRALMQQCMIHLLRQAGQSSPAQLQWLVAAHDDRLWRVLTEIFDHPEADHSLESLAALAGMSRSSFAENFKRTFERGPIEVLKQVRLQLAARLLIASDLAVEVVAREVGYASRSYFSREFHKFSDCSPADFRNRHRNLR